MVSTTTRLRAHVVRHPLAFAALWFAINFALLRVPSLLPGSNTILHGAISLAGSLAVTLALLLWLGWLGDVGFNGPAHWRDLRVLWLPALAALLALTPLVFTVRFISSGAGVAFAVSYAILTAASEEALNRGLILQTLRPYGPVAAALLSALFFGLSHLNNLFYFLSLVVIAQVVWSVLMGVSYASFRLRTNTIWPLIALHACNDIAIDISWFATARGEGAVASTSSSVLLTSVVALIVVYLVLAIYGLFLLRPPAQASGKPPVPSPVGTPDSVTPGTA